MAEIRNIDIKNDKITVMFSIEKEEYKILQNHTTDIILLPSGAESLPHSLTTGRLGNSNRIMLPKKILETFGISELNKKAPATIFNISGDAFLLIKIKSSKTGIPKFGGE